MPTQSWKNLDPETGVHWDADEGITATNTMGAVAEMFRSWPWMYQNKSSCKIHLCLGETCGSTGKYYLHAM